MHACMVFDIADSKHKGFVLKEIICHGYLVVFLLTKYIEKYSSFCKINQKVRHIFVIVRLFSPPHYLTY